MNLLKKILCLNIIQATSNITHIYNSIWTRKITFNQKMSFQVQLQYYQWEKCWQRERMSIFLTKTVKIKQNCFNKRLMINGHTSLNLSHIIVNSTRKNRRKNTRILYFHNLSENVTYKIIKGNIHLSNITPRIKRSDSNTY